ncbi:RNA polymerase sigma-70 factor [Chitinophaga niabensis]|uniref:RNA polymerase sigma factor n=1 Tax=Chitinophaga niabensis TaxID=536979 RepID=UPI0031BACC19
MNMIDANSADADIWLAVRNEDKAAFNLLFNRYWGRLYQTALSLLGDNEASEEIVHDVFLNIWLKRNTLDITDFKNYLISATRYHIYRELKAKKATQELPAEYSGSFSFNYAEEKLSEQTFREQLSFYLGALPKRCKEIFLLSRQENLSNQEIADRLNISKRSVENQITHALQYLRVNLKNFFLLFILLDIK